MTHLYFILEIIQTYMRLFLSIRNSKISYFHNFHSGRFWPHGQLTLVTLFDLVVIFDHLEIFNCLTNCDLATLFDLKVVFGPIASIIEFGALLSLAVFDLKWPFLTPAKVHVKRESQGNNAMSVLKDTSHRNHSKPLVLKVSHIFYKLILK